MRFVRAALTDDRATALALTLTHEQMSAISKHAPDEATWNANLGALLDGLAREGREGKGRFEVTRAQLVTTRVLSPDTDEKVRRKIDVAIVEVLLTREGQEDARGIPWLFVLTKSGWRFSPHH